jgi:hypothetical protein
MSTLLMVLLTQPLLTHVHFIHETVESYTDDNGRTAFERAPGVGSRGMLALKHATDPRSQT